MEEDFVIAKSIIDSVFPPGTGIIDVGSHEGDFVQFVFGEGARRNAIMIEPIPGKAETIRNRFPSAKVFQCAISKEESQSEMFITTNYPKCSALYDRQAFDEVKILNERERIDVNIRRLDNVLDEAGFDDIPTERWYLKIDTEGYELETLMSLGKYATNNKIVAGQFEYGGCWKERGLKIQDMIELLKDAGFVCMRALVSQNNLQFAKIEDTNDDYEHTNIYFIRKEFVG